MTGLLRRRDAMGGSLRESCRGRGDSVGVGVGEVGRLLPLLLFGCWLK